MSIHVQRGEPNRASSYILVIGLFFALCAFMFEAYKKPRTVYFEAMPETAKLYIENNVVCESLPCEITLQNWPKTVRVVADRHYSQEVPISIIEFFTSNRHSYEIHLEAFPEQPSEPNIIPEIDIPPKPQPKKPPKPTYSPPVAPKPKVQAKLPKVCMETAEERQREQNRQAILCYHEDEKRVISNAQGECYATYTVSTEGRVRNIQGFGCMHDGLLEFAKRAFENRLYLPALKNSKPIEMAVEGEIKYGPPNGSDYPFRGEARTATTVNRDARVQSCPLVVPPKTLKRSGYCIYEFDLTAKGQVSQVREIKCTDASLKTPTLASFNHCLFILAKTDGETINRPYMKHQIDVNVYDQTGQKVPVHASFSENAVNKPYIVFN